MAAQTQGTLPIDAVDRRYHPRVFQYVGAADGPRVLVVAGLHGSEVSSIEAAYRVIRDLGTIEVHGTVTVIPIVNAGGFFARSLYVNPLDGKNVNRSFPGNIDGSPSERLAAALMASYVSEADAVFDLHGGDLVEALDPFLLVDPGLRGVPNVASLVLAQATGFPQVIASRVQGSLVGAASEMGKAAVLIEAGQQGVVTESNVELLRLAVWRGLRGLGTLSDSGCASIRSDAGTPIGALGVYRNGWSWLSSSDDGIWKPRVRVGQTVSDGEPLGIVESLDTRDVVRVVTSPHAGCVVFLVTALSTTPGTPLLAVARESSSWPRV